MRWGAYQAYPVVASPPLKRRLTTANWVVWGLQERALILKNQARASTLVREVGVPRFWRSRQFPDRGSHPPLTYWLSPTPTYLYEIIHICRHLCPDANPCPQLELKASPRASALNAAWPG